MDESRQRLMMTVGTFDGVHRGHRMLLQQLGDEAAKAGMEPAVVTFGQHPLSLIDPARCPRQLTTIDERRALLEQQVGRVIVLDFTERLRSLTAEQFLTMLRDDYGAAALLLGFNNHIGSDRKGYDELLPIANHLGIKFIREDELQLGDIGAVCSSTVRSLIAAGDMSAATALLGHPYPLSGTVTHGRALGRTIGFPTANIEVESPLKLIPAAGVYAGYVDVTGERHPVMVNIGHRPTVDGTDSKMSIEAHIIDFQRILYGQQLSLQLINRLRSERRFPTLDALRTQLTLDAEATKGIICR